MLSESKYLDLLTLSKNVRLVEDIPYIFIIANRYSRLAQMPRNLEYKKIKALADKSSYEWTEMHSCYGAMHSVNITLIPRKPDGLDLWKDLCILEEEGEFGAVYKKWNFDDGRLAFGNDLLTLTAFYEKFESLVDWQKLSYSQVFNNVRYIRKKIENRLLLEHLKWSFYSDEEDSRFISEAWEVQEVQRIPDLPYYLNHHERLLEKLRIPELVDKGLNFPPRLHVRYVDSLKYKDLNLSEGHDEYGKVKFAPPVFQLSYDIPLWGFYDDFDIPGEFVFHSQYPYEYFFKVIVKTLSSDFEAVDKNTGKVVDWWKWLLYALDSSCNIFVTNYQACRKNRPGGLSEGHVDRVRRIGKDILGRK